VPSLKRVLELEGEARSFWFTVLSDDREFSREVLKNLEDVFARVRGDLNITRRLGKKCLVLVWNDREEFVKGVVARMGIWDGASSKAFYAASCEGGPHLICMYRADDLFTEILPHELTHLILAIALDPSGSRPIPLWLNEGLAECQTAQPLAERAAAIRTAKEEGNYIPIRELVRFNGYPDDFDRCRLFYEESAALVKFLLEEETYPGEFFELAKRLTFWGGDFLSVFNKLYNRRYTSFDILEESFGRFIDVNAD